MNNFYDNNLKRSFLIGMATAMSLAPRDKASRRAVGLAANSAKPVAPKQFAGLGRNEPCHCGSGRKFKKCCQYPPQAAPEPSTALQG